MPACVSDCLIWTGDVQEEFRRVLCYVFVLSAPSPPEGRLQWYTEQSNGAWLAPLVALVHCLRDGALLEKCKVGCGGPPASSCSFHEGRCQTGLLCPDRLSFCQKAILRLLTLSTHPLPWSRTSLQQLSFNYMCGSVLDSVRLSCAAARHMHSLKGKIDLFVSRFIFHRDTQLCVFKRECAACMLAGSCQSFRLSCSLSPVTLMHKARSAFQHHLEAPGMLAALLCQDVDVVRKTLDQAYHCTCD